MQEDRPTIVNTLGDALAQGWKLEVKCGAGKSRMGLKSMRECTYSALLHIESLIWTRGLNFPLVFLKERMMCPRCRSRKVKVYGTDPKGDPYVGKREL